MDSNRFAALPAQLRTAAHAITALPDVAELPPVCSVNVEWEVRSATLTLAAQLKHATAEDTEKISELQQWAAALGGGLHLDEEMRSSRPGWCWRNLSARATLRDGTKVDIWTHLNYRTGADRTAAAVAA